MLGKWLIFRIPGGGDRPPLAPPLITPPICVLGCELSSSNLKEFPVSIVERLKLWGDIDEVVGGSLLVLIDS